jgi:hypothetical protein
MANFCLCGFRKKLSPKIELPQNLCQTFDCVASEKKSFSQKFELPQIYDKLLLV